MTIPYGFDSEITPNIQWASIVVTFPRPRKARDATAPLAQESSSGQRTIHYCGDNSIGSGTVALRTFRGAERPPPSTHTLASE
ncbi:hypothetical protein Y032_0102g3457 [Ancylostoma ceylanicum]|uniref:Uncharacterized protein n=1 Tax=Ancylostoma ceylanicum TaxID=53326 RepID=A0A016TGK5_9BILA|nr:hypothetical protein Y032_0102g3457 [Ancylostoma ceylanicum]